MVVKRRGFTVDVESGFTREGFGGASSNSKRGPEEMRPELMWGFKHSHSMIHLKARFPVLTFRYHVHNTMYVHFDIAASHSKPLAQTATSRRTNPTSMSTGAAAVQTPVHHNKPYSLVLRGTIHASRTESTCASGRAFAIPSARRRTQPSGRTGRGPNFSGAGMPVAVLNSDMAQWNSNATYALRKLASGFLIHV